ncbi:MAG: hypothetical protein IKX60_01630 [Bacteroidales bacterium]|nr:hypothetical protein [Bacteroidales bacterium]
MKKFFLLLAATLLVAVACNKTDVVNIETVSKGHPVSLSLELPSETTKVSHEYVDNASGTGKKIQTGWQEDDFVIVYVGYEEECFAGERFEIDPTSIANGGKTATFVNDNCELYLSNGDFIAGGIGVYYITPDNYSDDDVIDISNQKGTLDDLPDFLKWSGPLDLPILTYPEVTPIDLGTVFSTPITLEPRLAYFHFILTLPSNAIKIENIRVGGCPDSENPTTFGGGFMISSDDPIFSLSIIDRVDYLNIEPIEIEANQQSIDFYVAFFAEDQADNYSVAVQVTTTTQPGGQGETESAWYYKNWSPRTEYKPGKVYKVTGTLDMETSSIGGYAYVEMGDGLKWATKNVGATSETDYGDYFAWGETAPYYSSQSPLTWKEGKKYGYYWDSYSYGRASSLTKYVASASYGTVDNKTVLEGVDDAATANWGNTWRTPTDDEWTWLRNNCTWTQTDDYQGSGIAGKIVTSNVSGFEGNTIFLPDAGYRKRTSLDDVGEFGYYWSSSLNTDDSSRAWRVTLASSYVSRYYFDRYNGLSVRPVSE